MENNPTPQSISPIQNECNQLPSLARKSLPSFPFSESNGDKPIMNVLKNINEATGGKFIPGLRNLLQSMQIIKSTGPTNIETIKESKEQEKIRKAIRNQEINLKKTQSMLQLSKADKLHLLEYETSKMNKAMKRQSTKLIDLPKIVNLNALVPGAKLPPDSQQTQLVDIETSSSGKFSLNF